MDVLHGDICCQPPVILQFPWFKGPGVKNKTNPSLNNSTPKAALHRMSNDHVNSSLPRKNIYFKLLPPCPSSQPQKFQYIIKHPSHVFVILNISLCFALLCNVTSQVCIETLKHKYLRANLISQETHHINFSLVLW